MTWTKHLPQAIDVTVRLVDILLRIIGALSLLFLLGMYLAGRESPDASRREIVTEKK